MTAINHKPLRRLVPLSTAPGSAFPQEFPERWTNDGSWRAGRPCSHLQSWQWKGGAPFFATFIPRAADDGAGEGALDGEVYCRETGKNSGREYFVAFVTWQAWYDAGHVERATA